MWPLTGDVDSVFRSGFCKMIVPIVTCAHWGFPALTEPSASPAASLGIFEVRRVLDASGWSMLAPLQTGAARFSSYLLSRARKVLGSHLFSPCGVLEFCSISTRKLAAHGFGASMAAMVSFPPQRYHYFLVLDFEATCDKPQIHPQEIIEFPILKLNGRTMEIESTFHMYVQPVVHPQLTPFCTELTGIIQAMVDGQPSLQQVLERVDEWMAKEGLLDPNVKSIFVTCGDWDLKVMLPGQCQYLGLPVADYFKQWINLKKVLCPSSTRGLLPSSCASGPRPTPPCFRFSFVLVCSHLFSFLLVLLFL
uniref:ERI1 exoribonuclease family member 3 n=1 Tax=Sus scrofa TaxID=9823 RepID=A0A8D1NQ20_PIG